MSAPVYLNALGVICALGADVTEVRAALFATTPPSVSIDSDILPGKSLPLARVRTSLASVADMPVSMQTRNNALLLSALAQIRAEVDAAIMRFGAQRVAIVLGTSTSGISEAEQALATYVHDGVVPSGFDLGQQELGSPVLALRHVLGNSGPGYVVSTACSSSAKAIATAARLLRAGLVDAVIAGGADSLCRFTVAGFSALESVSRSGSNPLAAARDGIHIGEGAALFLVTREPGPVRLAGYGESSDAHHISAPLPDGSGARTAMLQALGRANIAPEQIDYVNLHGTATPQNDAMECRAVAEVFGDSVATSSTKRLTGHTLGAAGAIEAALCFIALTGNSQGLLPTHWCDGALDETLPALQLVQSGQSLGRPLHYALSNSFAFGGSNAALILAGC